MDSKPKLRPTPFLTAFPHPTATTAKYQVKFLLLSCIEKWGAYTYIVLNEEYKTSFEFEKSDYKRK